MRWTGLLVGGTSLFFAGLFAQAADAPSNAPAPGSPAQVSPAQKASAEAASRAAAVKAFGKTIDTQDRVNHYFHDEVGPKLTPCWAALKGKGTISVEVQYAKAGSRWSAGQSTIRSSTLRKRDPRALECVERALKGTSFAVEKADGDAKEFFVNWTLPVPWPKDMKDVVALMISTGGGGGGGCGPEAPPQCWDCAYLQILPGLPGISFCAHACVGYRTCTNAESGCNMGPISPLCSSGSPFGNSGGVIAY